jgi:hypothetical protein
VSKIWYCYNCGYEVTSKGRCHLCKEKFLLSPLPELEAGDEEAEVGYRLADWEDTTRGRLIHSLVRGGIPHRFEDDELVVGVDDEEKVDELVAAAAEAAAEAAPPRSDLVGPGGDRLGDDRADGPFSGPDGDVVELTDEQIEILTDQIRLLHDAADRLQTDPTDMEADGDVAEASAAVFMTDDLPGVDPDVWAAVGRTTRRLLGALGSDEAQEEEITRQSGILAVLLAGGGVTVERQVLVEKARGDEAVQLDDGAVQLEDGPVEDDEAELDEAQAGQAVVDDAPVEVAVTPVPVDSEAVGTGGAVSNEDETVYELPEWLPEQRAELTYLLTRAGIRSSWDRGDLVVPADRETEVEALFDGIHGVAEGDEGGEAQYQQIEELFNATSRLVGDPDDLSRSADFLRAVPAVEGSPPLGFDGISWSAIRKRGRVLADSIEHQANPEVILAEASALRDLLRALV